MSPAALEDFVTELVARRAATVALVDELDPAPVDVLSQDARADRYAEALFLQTFTSYETDLEALFLHYVTGGLSRTGVAAESFLRVTDEQHARQLTKAGWSFLSWAKPASIRTTATTYIRNGWPFVDMMATKEQVLADSERIRNRIAHNSLEARQQFNVVQRNYLQTERLFSITPGQFLRVRSTRLRQTHLAHFAGTLFDTLEAVVDPLS